MADVETVGIRRLLGPSDDRNEPSLENRVAYQWRERFDTLGYRHAKHRDRVVLDWLERSLRRGAEPRAALDVGAAFGNYTFMLNALLGCDQSIAYFGIELSDHHLEFANSFCSEVPGYANCSFMKADVEDGLPFEDDTFDAVNLADIIEHLEHPADTLREVRRVTKPGGSIIVSTPQRTSLFKSTASIVNKLSRGRLYERYYRGKEADLDSAGRPIMETDAGHDHISEMNLKELLQAAEGAGLVVGEVELMAVMSGSAWFDGHPFLLASLLCLEAVHGVLRRASWAHSVVVCFIA